MPKKRSKPKYRTVQDLVRYTPAEGFKGHMKPGAPMDLWLSRYECDSSLRTHHKLSCCECGFRHLFTYEVYTTKQLSGPNKGEPGWWLKVRAYSDDETRPKKVIRSRRG